MDLIRPHVYLLGAAVFRPLAVPITLIDTKVPNGSEFRIDYILVSYPVADNGEATQLSGDLTFVLAISDGLQYTNRPIQFRDMTTPAAGAKLRAAWGLRIEVPANAVLTMEVRFIAAAEIPEWVSITYLGRKGWGRR